MNQYLKILPYENVSQGKIGLEAELQRKAYNFVPTPKVIDLVYNDNEGIIAMEKIPGMCLADIYGEDPYEIPEHVWQQIHDIIYTLYNDAGIEYIDITPYNFIEVNDKVYIIDFGHAYYKNDYTETNWFLAGFLHGLNEWNPDFK
jgi:tRNA A-37 threonylcarbamoyl transferase component Bud32